MGYFGILAVIVLAFLAAVIGHFPVRYIVRYCREKIIGDKEGADTKYFEIAWFVGMAERALYVFAWYFGQLEFVAVWLAFKVAVEWKEGWNGSGDKGSCDCEKQKRHARWNLFVLGNALSLLTTAFFVLIFIAFVSGRHGYSSR